MIRTNLQIHHVGKNVKLGMNMGRNIHYYIDGLLFKQY